MIFRYRNQLFIGASVLLTSCAQIFMKLGMIDLQQSLAVNSISELSNQVIITVSAWVFAGLVFYAISLFSWMLALRAYQLSFAYPLLSLSYVLVYIMAMFVPGITENFSVIKSAGILLIIFGVILISSTSSGNLYRNS